MNGIPYVLPENMRLTRSEMPMVNVEWVSVWLAVIMVNIRMMMTMKRRSRMMRLKVSLSSSS